MGWRCSACGSENPIGSDTCANCSVPFKTSLALNASPGGELRALAANPWSGFGERVRRGFKLIGVSWRVLKLDPELMAFPLFAGILITLVCFFFMTTLNGLSIGALDTPQMWSVPKWQLYLMYVAIYFIGVFCQAAIVAAAMLRFQGRDPKLRDGFNAAASRALRLAGWAVIAATVALLLRWLQEVANRHGGRGRVAVTVVDIAWQVATYFAIPALLFEDITSTGAIRRSGQIFRSSWRESLAGMLGLGAALFIVALGAMFLLAPIAIYGGLAGLIVTMAVLTAIFVVGATLGAINNAALYFYAMKGDAPVPFSIGDVLGRPTPVPALATV